MLKTVDVCLLSSHYEGLSLSSLEGFASGKPFIGSDVPGIRDLVQGYGILFPDGDSIKLAEEITKLMADKNYYDTVAQRCLERVSEFDISKMVEKTITLYTESWLIDQS